VVCGHDVTGQIRKTRKPSESAADSQRSDALSPSEPGEMIQEFKKSHGMK
jgi:hypothetical protein